MAGRIFFFQVAWASPVLPESRSQWEQNCKALLLLMFSARTVDVIVHPRVIPYFGLRSSKLPCFALFSLVSMTWGQDVTHFIVQSVLRGFQYCDTAMFLVGSGRKHQNWVQWRCFSQVTLVAGYQPREAFVLYKTRDSKIKGKQLSEPPWMYGGWKRFSICPRACK